MLFKKIGNTENQSFIQNIKRILIGGILGIAVFFLLLLLFSFIMTVGAIPDSTVTVFAFIAVALASFFAGFASLLKIGSGGLINGLICGGILATLHLLFSLIFGESQSLVSIIVSIAVELLLATFGGIVAVNIRAE